jgi:hypothetical protein
LVSITAVSFQEGYLQAVELELTMREAKLVGIERKDVETGGTFRPESSEEESATVEDACDPEYVIGGLAMSDVADDISSVSTPGDVLPVESDRVLCTVNVFPLESTSIF